MKRGSTRSFGTDRITRSIGLAVTSLGASGPLLLALMAGSVAAVACSASGSDPDLRGREPEPGVGGDQQSGAGGSAGETAGGAGGEAGGATAGTEGVGGSTVDPSASTLCGTSESGLPSLRRLSRREIEGSLRDIFPALAPDWTSTLSADPISEAGFDNDASVLLVGKQTARELAASAETVATALVPVLPQALPCAATTPDAACAGEFLDTVGRRLFRRPLSEAERTAYLDFWNTAHSATGDFAQSIGWLTRGLIESPHFVYRREVGTAQADAPGTTRLDQYEIATELAYTFSGRGPSDVLLDQAAAGELSSPDVLVAAARDLLMGAGREVIQTFFDAYVGHARVTTIAKANVQEFAGLREQMLEETRRFIDEVVLVRGGGSRELLTADFTTPSTALASFYGFTGASVPDADYAVVPRPEGRGIGLMAQGSVLSTLAQPDGSSPTKRGQFIFKRLLCNVVPPVPAAIPELSEPREDVTTRQRYEELHATGACQGCHSTWDPIGFGFEHFDEAGRYRADEGGLTIDASSHVPHRGETLFEFDGQEDLMTQLAAESVIQECLTGYLTTFAFGEELTCAGETRRAEFMDGSIGFVDYLASLAGEPHFVARSTE